MRKWIALFLSISLIVSCNESKKDKVIDMQDVIPQAQDKKAKPEPVRLPDTLNRFIDTALLSALKLPVFGIKKIELELLPQRLSPKKTCSYTMAYKNDSLIYVHWSYKDSIFTKNALYNWLDCFGKKCRSIRLGQSVSMQKDALLILVSDTSVTYLSSSQALKKEEWLNYFETYTKRKDWRILIEQKKNGKATWFTVKENEITPILIQ